MKQARKARGLINPLYRKENTRTHGVRHGNGGEYRWNRNKKDIENNPRLNSSMKSHHQHGLDYTPLFKFLISKVGKNWNEIYSEAVSRLDREEPIFWIVARSELDRQAFVRIGEDSYFSGLFVDEQNSLRKVCPRLTAEQMIPFSLVGTHTFNGERFGQEYRHDGYRLMKLLVDELENEDDPN